MQFLKYEAVTGEKHFGIATVKLYGRIILRYKIVPNKDGTGWFPCPASYKTGTVNGQDKYVSAFTLDSNSENEALQDLIKDSVRQCMMNASQRSNPVVQGPVQPNPNNLYNTQPKPQPQYQQQSFMDTMPNFPDKLPEQDDGMPF